MCKIIETAGELRVIINDNGNYVIAYENWHGSKKVAENIDYSDLEDALYLVKKWYSNPQDPNEPQCLTMALEDFYTVVKEIVDKVYEENNEFWEWLQEVPTLVTDNKGLFKRAALDQPGEFPFTEGNKGIRQILSK